VAAIRLEFIVDGDVYPELHAALSSIGSDEARGERVRQLASTGLVWELVRSHGSSPARMSGPLHGAEHAHPLAAKGGSSRARSKSAVRLTEHRAAAAGSRSESPESAHDAQRPAPPGRNQRSDARTRDRLRDAGLPDVPVLSDVVHFASPAPPSVEPAAPSRRPDRAASTPPIAQTAGDRDRSLAPRARDDGIVEPANEPVEQTVALAPVVTLRHTSASRSRLQRMKEKGLFRNG
jgi:hypothetical protein